mgnify:CR=1 FL=1
MAAASGRHGDERRTMMAMRARLVAYCKGFPGARELRPRLTHVESLDDIQAIAENFLHAIPPPDPECQAPRSDAVDPE